MNELVELRKMLEENNGYVTTKQIRSLGIDSRGQKKLIDEKFLAKEAHGLYLGFDYFPDPFVKLQHQMPKAIFSHLTALFLHDLSDRDPLVYMLTIPTGSSSAHFKNNELRFFYNNDSLIQAGVVEILSPSGSKIKVFDVERTLCDCVKNIERLDRDLVITGLRRYLRSPMRKDSRLLEYADLLKIRKEIYRYMEVL